MERNWRKYTFFTFLGICSLFAQLAHAAQPSVSSQYSFHYPVLNDLVAKATSQVSPVSYVSKNGLVHLRMRPVFAFLPSVKNMGYSVWGHMQRVGQNFHKAILSGFPISYNNAAGYGPNIAASSTYDNHIGSNNISPIKSAWSRIRCFPFGSKCHQQQNYNDNHNNNDNYNNYNNNNYKSNDNNYNSYRSNDNYNNNNYNNNNYQSNDNFNNYNSNSYRSNDNNFVNYNTNYI